MVACGGIDGKVHVFKLNTSENNKKKLDPTIKLIQKKHEFNGHTSMVTCSGFLSPNFLITGSDDSTLLLWDFEKTGRYLVKYADHTQEI